MNKNDWIEKTLQASEDVSKIELDKKLLLSLYDIPRRNKTIYIGKKGMWIAAASLTLLIGLNIFSSLNYSRSKMSSSTNTEQFADQYFSNINDLRI